MTDHSVPVYYEFWGYGMNKAGKIACSNGPYTFWGKIHSKPGKQVT